jgi:hypothetical protein
MIHKKEFDYLQKVYEEQNFRMILLHGTAGGGKTYLVRNFLKDKKGFYFKCLSQHPPVQIRRFIRVVRRQYPDFESDITWKDFLSNLYSLAKKENFIVVWDDFHFLYKITQDILTSIEKHSVNSPFTIFITSSFPQANFISFRFSTFSKDRFHAIELKPLSFREFRDYYKDMDPIRQIELYGITGGVSRYMEWIDPKLDLFDNVKQNFISPERVPFYDPTSVLRYEFHEPSTYYSVLQVLAYHELKIGDLSHQLNLQTHNLTSFVDRLREMKLIGRVVPGNSTNPKVTRKSKYMISDMFLYFWFRYVYFDPEALHMLDPDIIVDHLQDDYNNFLDHVVVEICKQWLADLEDPFSPVLTSPWWDYEAHNVDIMSTDYRRAIFGDIFVDETLYTKQMYRSFVESTQVVPFKTRLRQKHYYFISKKGFTQDLRKVVGNRKNVKLITLEELVELV